jgi:hypothetical protein
MKNDWTPEQEKLLVDIWPTGESIKRHIKALGDRSYTTIISHAKKVLKLGPRPKSARGSLAFAWPIMKGELEKGPGTAPELIARTGLSMAVVCHRLREANPGPASEIHIIGWRKRSTGGSPTAIYAIGPGVNAPTPKPFTPSEKWLKKKSRRAGSSNPFAVAAGRVSVQATITGRVFKHLHDDELEAA